MLKKRFAQLQGSPAPAVQPAVSQPVSSSVPVQPVAPQRPVQPVVSQPVQPVAPVQPVVQQQSIPVQGGRSPLEALGAAQQFTQQPATINVVEVEGQQNAVVTQGGIPPVTTQSQETLSAPVEQVVQEEVNPIEASLEELKEDYDDAKLNSIIIEQVKELIEIDTNLNNKIEDVRLDLNKEVQEREKLKKLIEDHHNELKELEKSIDKFIALYELVTNQFNPFVKQGDTETKQKMEQLMGSIHSQQQGIAPEQNVHEETDFHFVTKLGTRVKSLYELSELLKVMPEDEFKHHVNETKNDFATWIDHALRNPVAAAKIKPLRVREDIIAALAIAPVKKMIG